MADSILIDEAVPIILSGFRVCKETDFPNPKPSRTPFSRLVGNVILNFIAKISTGYWELSDPTNGFIAMDADAWRSINESKIDDNISLKLSTVSIWIA